MRVCQNAYMRILCRSSALRGQKMESDPWEMELDTAMNHHVGAGNKPQVSASCLNC